MGTTITLPHVPDEWTTDDLDDLSTDYRYEIHNGKLVIMSPVRIAHQDVELRICNLLRRAGRQAYTQVGVRRAKNDFRVADVAAFHEEPDRDASLHDAVTVALIVEVLSATSTDKDRDPQWYADLEVPAYWLAEPTKTGKNALITRYELAVSESGRRAYVEIDTKALDKLERDGVT